MLPGNTIVVLDRGNNTTCTVNLHGATVVSWRYIHQEQFFMGRRAVFNGKKAICGGIPFVFPQYGPWSLGPYHGFARVIPWTVEKEPTHLPKSKDIEAIFSLTDTHYTRSMWNHPFRIIYKITLREKELEFDIKICNTSPNLTFSFNISLNTYVKVPDVKKCSIQGLKGCNFVDKTRNSKLYEEERNALTVQNWTDRIYKNTPDEHVLIYGVMDRKIRIEKCNLPDTVIWNPWIALAKELPDFEDEEYPFMLSIETGNVSSPVVLRPGATFEASQKFEIIKVYDTLLLDFM